MDLLTISAGAHAVIALVDWKKVSERWVSDAVSTSVKTLLGRLKPDEREKTAKQAIALFATEFLTELDDKIPLTSAVPGYHDHLKRLIEHAAPDISGWLQPETKEVDLKSVERMWSGLGLDELPEDFDWMLVAKSYARAIRKHVKNDPDLRDRLDTALREEQTELQQKSAELLARMAGPDSGFDLTGYRDYLRSKCAVLQLSAMHTSTYERRVNLWNIFVPQSARQSAPVRDLPHDLRRRFREEGHLTVEHDDAEVMRLHEQYQSSPIKAILDVLARNRRIVVLGDPGSGKTSLLKFLVMRWLTQELGSAEDEPLPVWIDLKEYAQEHSGFLEYCESGCATYRLDARELEKRLKAGEAVLYLDGLDEIFDGPTRGLVIKQIAAFVARYAQMSVVVTSRIVGYEPELLDNANFAHATLEDFDDPQIAEFLAKWHDAAEDDAKQRLRLQGQLGRALRESRAVRELAGNPLLLTMMAILNRNQDLPRDRVELYAQASRVLLHEWDASRSIPVDTFGRQEKEELLRELAGTMQKRNGGLAGNLIHHDQLVKLFRKFLKNLDVLDPYHKAISLVKQLNERNFILCFVGADRYSFVHRTFLEYFCASWFADSFQKKQTLTLEQLKKDVFGVHWKDKAWHEVLRLVVGMVGEKQAEELIRFLMEQNGRDEKLSNIMLAAGCLSEVRNRRAIQATDDALWRTLADKIVLFNFSDPSISSDFDSIVKAARLIGSVWRSEKVRLWLTSAVEGDANPAVRMILLQELAQGWKEHADTLPFLKQLARSDADFFVQGMAVGQLAQGWPEDADTLPFLKKLARSNVDAAVRGMAVKQLAQGWPEDADTLPFLKQLARSETDFFVRRVVVEQLAQGWPEDTTKEEFMK